MEGKLKGVHPKKPHDHPIVGIIVMPEMFTRNKRSPKDFINTERGGSSSDLGKRKEEE